MAPWTEDSLREYQRKRDFSKTREPAGKPAKKTGNRFVVQKHAATRLHYDFRLELDGVLKSWAVTKGPSLNPRDRRLAVQVEDHPVEYGDFEGRIPKGQYGGGTVMLWDRGTWESIVDPHEGLETGNLKFKLHGERMRGEWHLVRMKRRPGEKRDNWLLIKSRDDNASDDDDLTEEFDTSVKTGRSMGVIAEGDDVWNSNRAGTRGGARDPVGGVRITHPDKVLFPDMGLTKQDLIDYYRAVEKLIMPHLEKRLVSLVRCPDGSAKKCFFQKHASDGFPEAFKSLEIRESNGGTAEYLYIDGFDGVIAAVQVGTLEFHVWGSQIADVEKPTRLVFDLDPDPSVAFAVVKKAAFELRDVLSELGLETFPMLTGGKGVHVIAPIAPRVEWKAAKAFCRAIATAMESAHPDRYVTNMAKAKRRGRIFIDYLRNDRGSTAITPYSTRAKPGASVAVPISWDELKKCDSGAAFDVPKMIRRVARLKQDPWPGFFRLRQSLTKALLKSAGVEA